jgi:hypothetical protein
MNEFGQVILYAYCFLVNSSLLRYIRSASTRGLTSWDMVKNHLPRKHLSIYLVYQLPSSHQSCPYVGVKRPFLIRLASSSFYLLSALVFAATTKIAVSLRSTTLKIPSSLSHVGVEIIDTQRPPKKRNIDNTASWDNSSPLSSPVNTPDGLLEKIMLAIRHPITI